MITTALLDLAARAETRGHLGRRLARILRELVPMAALLDGE